MNIWQRILDLKPKKDLIDWIRGMLGNDEFEEEVKSYTLSSFDKLDWRRRIEQQMWRAVQASNIYGRYHTEVLKVEACVGTNFAGLDFKTPIRKNIDELNSALGRQLRLHLDGGYYYKPESLKDLTCVDRAKLIRRIYFKYWGYRFEFVRDLLAKNRGLLWGSVKVGGGKQMEDPD